MRCHSVASFISPLGRYFVSGSAPRLPTRITLFTDAISSLPGKQFAHAALVPLLRHDLKARDALAREHLDFAHAAHRGERFGQAFEIYSRCDGKRETRHLVDCRIT